MGKITLSNIEVDVIRKNIKNMRLVVYNDGRVRISVPLRTSDEVIRLFVISKINWIKKQQLKFLNVEIKPIKEFILGESHYFLGNQYLLNVIYGNIASKVEIRNEQYLDLYVREGSSIEKREQVLNEWYRKQIKELIPVFIEKWQSVMGVEVNSFGVKNMKTRWGTCNVRNHRIWLNLQLAKKPEYCIEYVVVHEMVHLLERGHNKRFELYMDKFIPQWRSYKEELNPKV